MVDRTALWTPWTARGQGLMGVKAWTRLLAGFLQLAPCPFARMGCRQRELGTLWAERQVQGRGERERVDSV